MSLTMLAQIAMALRQYVVLASLCAALAVVVLSELEASSSSSSLDESSAPSPATLLDRGVMETSASAPFSLPSLENFAAITERPLFSPSRQRAKIASGESDAWSSFVLVGIIITADLREAMVLHNQPPMLVHVQEGEAIDGWTLESLFPDHAVFRHDSEEHELRFDVVATRNIPMAPEPRKIAPVPAPISGPERGNPSS